MRVIAGQYRRRTLETAPGKETTRPTADRVKESLFSILMPRLPGARVLDLFSGSGALGIEALSRGAEHVIFVENAPEALLFLKKNIAALKISARQVLVVAADVESFLQRPYSFIRQEEFAVSRDLIFADPPYAADWYARGMEQLELSGLVSADAQVIIEKSARLPTVVGGHPLWECSDTRSYGAACLEFWQKKLAPQ